MDEAVRLSKSLLELHARWDERFEIHATWNGVWWFLRVIIFTTRLLHGSSTPPSSLFLNFLLLFPSLWLCFYSLPSKSFLFPCIWRCLPSKFFSCSLSSALRQKTNRNMTLTKSKACKQRRTTPAYEKPRQNRDQNAYTKIHNGKQHFISEMIYVWRNPQTKTA